MDRETRQKQKIVIVGATSAIAHQCARLMVEEDPDEVFLLGRNEEKLKRVVADLKVRAPKVKFQHLKLSFTSPEAVMAAVDHITHHGEVDLVLIAQGMLSDQSACQDNLSLCHEGLLINGISPVLFAEAFAMKMAKANKGTIVLIGSVAGDRGRRSNYVYGAGKGLIERYAQGLQHRFSNTPVHILLVKPGPTDTPMTAHFKAQGKRLATTEKVAAEILIAIKKKKQMVYVPYIWKYIMAMIRGLPTAIFSKLNI